MGKRYTHNKRGGLYEVITDKALLQCSTDQALEDTYETQHWTVYRGLHSNMVFIRLTVEFMDGRFIEVPT